MKDAFHPGFTLNGLPVAYEDLSEVAYSLVKEGEPFEREAGDFLLDWISNGPAITQKTSGSTGEPREVSLSKEAMVHSARATGEALGLPPGTRALMCLPAGTIAGKMMLVRAMVLGWKLTLVEPSSRPLEGVEGPLDFAAMVPLQLFRSLPLSGRIRTVLVGGAPLSRELLSRIPARGTAVYESYGMTETASHIALRRLSRVPLETDPETVLGPFVALEGITLGQDDRGCLMIHAPFLSPEPLVTNDLVSLEGSKAFRWLGRADHVVNSGGVKLIPEQLEARLSPAIQGRFILGGLPDPALGEQLVLILEGKKGPDDPLQDIRDAGILGKHETPRAVYWLEAFPETENGKINRPEILRQLKP